jgi:hypothetical protein
MRSRRRPAGGRPPKFNEARRPITVTLPERVLRTLEAVSSDRALAIVKCVDAVAGNGVHAARLVELVEVLPGKALIMVGPSRSLALISWLRLVEVAPGRYLLVLPTGTPVETLELEILDLLEKLGPTDRRERAMLRELRELLGRQRRERAVSKAELVFVDVAGKG